MMMENDGGLRILRSRERVYILKTVKGRGILNIIRTIAPSAGEGKLFSKGKGKRSTAQEEIRTVLPKWNAKKGPRSRGFLHREL